MKQKWQNALEDIYFFSACHCQRPVFHQMFIRD
jgi:hypothetical protein